MNMTGLEQLHQRKCDDETDRSPFQASQKHVEHPGPIVAQAAATLNSRKLSESIAPLPNSLLILGSARGLLWLALWNPNL